MVIMDQVGETEIRIRKAVVIPEEGFRFREQTATPLTDFDRDHFLSLLNHPPTPNEALKRTARRPARRKSHG
jgi:hypothetical protein